MKKLCIYHHQCMDGFTAAWTVKQFYGDDVDFYGGIHNTLPPDVTDRDIILVDFCYPSNIMAQIVNDAKSVLIIDHHITAEQTMSAIHSDKVTTYFDVNKSGAMLAWEFYFPNTPAYDFIKYVQDADLWLFELPNSKEVFMNTASYEYDFDIWTSLIQQNIDNMIVDGTAILRKHLKDVRELTNTVCRKMKIGGYEVPVFNLPYTMTSDAAGDASNHEAFAACYWDTPNGRVFGLRSKPSGVDVRLIAESYGGGGHKHASGFRVNYSDLNNLGLL